MEQQENLQWVNADPYHIGELTFKYTMQSYDRVNILHDYGTGENFTMVEVHTVTVIEENPGITVTELAKATNRTKSAVSQVVSRLEKRGMVQKTRPRDNGKKALLFVTPKGRELSIAHRAYDVKNVLCWHNKLKETFTDEELDVFYRVMAARLALSPIQDEDDADSEDFEE
ncbi:MarR family winged helix-turn-helix transcriptional regulator [Acidaminobacterium chupaoyuni]